MDRQIGPRRALIPAWLAIARALGEADAKLRKRGGSSGAMKTATAYLLGLLAIRFGANAYIMLGPLAPLAPPGDAAAIAWISACLACLPLAAASALSETPRGVTRRLDLSPLGAAARLASGALAPMASRLAVTAIAAALPAVAALPLLPASPAAYAATVAVTAVMAFFAALALKAALGAAYALAFGRSLSRSSRGGAHAALAMLLAILAASNPTPSYRDGRAGLSLFNSAAEYPGRLVPSFIAAAPARPVVRARAAAELGPPPGAGLQSDGQDESGVSAASVALYVAALAFAAASLSALEAAVARRVTARPRAMFRRRGAAARRLPGSLSAAAAILRAVEAHDRAGPAFSACLALAAAALVQGAKPIVPTVAGVTIALARVWKAFAGLAVDSATSRRLAMVLRQKARAEAYWLAATAALAVAAASPLFAAALALP